MAQIIKLPAYAKLNLALKVTGKRPDGFHELCTLFERVDLCDELTFTSLAGSQIKITCSNPAVPVDQRNLVHKAACLLQQRCNIKKGAKIEITKNIPVAAGLAGGSSNAATALVGLNKLWRLRLSRKELVALAGQIGSDVAFFLYDASWAVGTGRGEVIRPLKIRAKLCHLLITPRIPVLTKDVYNTYSKRFLKPFRKANRGGDFSLTNLNDDVTILICSLRKNDIIGAGARLFNDLESSILTLRPGLLKLKNRLQKSQVLGVSFSGSGPSIFALIETRAIAERLRVQYSQTYRQVYVVQTR